MWTDSMHNLIVIDSLAGKDELGRTRIVDLEIHSDENQCDGLGDVCYDDSRSDANGLGAMHNLIVIISCAGDRDELGEFCDADRDIRT